jgi:hypothetical protein
MRSGVIPIRIGFRTVPTGMAGITVSGNEEQIVGRALTIGTGFIGGTFAFDFAYSYSRYSVEVQDFFSATYAENMLTGSVIIYF